MIVRADMIIQQLKQRHTGDFFITEVKNGPTQIVSSYVRMDALAIKKSWAHPCFTGYEVKVSRNDFLRDEKWTAYMKYCNRFFFACPKDLISPDELPKEVGLVYYNPDKDTLYTKKNAITRPMELDANMLFYIIMSKLESDRHPFYSNDREYIEAYIQDKADKEHLAYKFKSKLINQVNEMADKLRDAENKIKNLDEMKKDYLKSADIMKTHGYDFWGNMLSWRLEDMFKDGGQSPVYKDLCDLQNDLSRIAEKYKPKELKK